VPKKKRKFLSRLERGLISMSRLANAEAGNRVWTGHTEVAYCELCQWSVPVTQVLFQGDALTANLVNSESAPNRFHTGELSQICCGAQLDFTISARV
jgi:hypothetical protein